MQIAPCSREHVGRHCEERQSIQHRFKAVNVFLFYIEVPPLNSQTMKKKKNTEIGEVQFNAPWIWHVLFNASLFFLTDIHAGGRSHTVQPILLRRSDVDTNASTSNYWGEEQKSK